MDWNAISAIGTILAAFVGIVGIWLNLWEKTKKLNTNFEMVPRFKIYLCNNSNRTTVITKMMCCVKTNIFYVKHFEGLSELTLPPATAKTIDITKQDIYDAYCQTQLSVLCNPNDKVKFILCDNYGRKYTIKTNLGIDAFKL